MSKFRVKDRKSGDIIVVSAITKDHLHVTGVEFPAGMFKEEKKVAPKKTDDKKETVKKTTAKKTTKK